MGEIFAKVVFFIVMLPILIFKAGYAKLKEFIKNNNYGKSWEYGLLAILVIILVILLMAGYR